MCAKYWLVFTDWTGRKIKPFLTLTAMNRFIKQNKHIKVVAKTKTIDRED